MSKRQRTDEENGGVVEIAGERKYTPFRPLKYGCNPQQQPAALLTIDEKSAPFEVLNGNPGYINLLDALNAWQLVKECREALSLPAAASFKHVSPAGCAVGVPLTDKQREVYNVGDAELTPLATAYVRAREADPKSSFGDFCALSDEVDECTAKLLSREVCDGIIAPGYSEAALEKLKKKKKGTFIILKADPAFEPPPVEFREVYGICFAQKRNTAKITLDMMDNVTTDKKEISEEAKRDMVLASICLKYTQSNSVGYAIDGQMIGVGAGQQSRVDCVKLAGGKVATWWLRHHPKVLGLKFKEGTTRTAKLNARVQYIEGDFTKHSKGHFDSLFDTPPEPLTEAEKATWLAELTGVSLSSDAFFPFPDNIDHCSVRGVTYIAQPGGSIQDETVTKACNEYGITQSHFGVRLFHH